MCKVFFSGRYKSLGIKCEFKITGNKLNSDASNPYNWKSSRFEETGSSEPKTITIENFVDFATAGTIKDMVETNIEVPDEISHDKSYLGYIDLVFFSFIFSVLSFKGFA